MPAAHRDEVELAMGRLVDKLLHAPTLRVKQLAAEGRFATYADALAELFELDPAAIAGVSSPPLPDPAGEAAAGAPDPVDRRERRIAGPASPESASRGGGRT